MPIVKEVKGDLIALAKAGEFDAIVHGCNCFATMGSGIAPQINKAFKNVLRSDKEHSIPVGSEKRLGGYSWAKQPDEQLVVINAYTQFTFTGRKEGKADVSYRAIAEVFSRLNSKLPRGIVVGIPLIGAGLAGGHWDAIHTIIDLVTPNLQIVLVHYDK